MFPSLRSSDSDPKAIVRCEQAVHHIAIVLSSSPYPNERRWGPPSMSRSRQGVDIEGKNIFIAITSPKISTVELLNMMEPIEERGEANELLNAQIYLWNHLFSFLKSMSLKFAVELGVADVLHKHGRPVPLSELVSVLSVPPAKADSVRRLMRSLVHSGIFAMRTDGAGEESYLLTPSSRLLVKEERASMSHYIQLILDPIMLDPSHLFGHSIKEGEPSPFDLFHKKAIWEEAHENPRFNKLVNEGMANDSRLTVEVLRRGSTDVFRGVRTLVDVGGGTGTMAVAIAEAFPDVKCTVFDLPHVIAAAPKNTIVDYVGGDMFERIPTADAVLLKCVLHNWSDEECIKILKGCKKVIPCEGGKVIIMDIVVGIVIDNQAALQTQFLFDLMMMLALTGKERDEGEWKNIFFGAGFSDYKITPSLGIRSVIELYP